jgi:hypothetical protein
LGLADGAVHALIHELYIIPGGVWIGGGRGGWMDIAPGREYIVRRKPVRATERIGSCG